MIKWHPQKFTGEVYGGAIIRKGTAEVLSALSYPGSCCSSGLFLGQEP